MEGPMKYNYTSTEKKPAVSRTARGLIRNKSLVMDGPMKYDYTSTEKKPAVSRTARGL
jgi:hypothetical protein